MASTPTSAFAPGLFAGKRALVTGGGTGIGLAITSELLRLDVQEAMRGAGAPILGEDGAFAIMRTSLQELLARELPPDMITANRAVARVRLGRPATLEFSDGSVEVNVNVNVV